MVDTARRYVDTVLVVDDGSTDETGPEALDHGAWVVRNMTTRHGAGAATQLGINTVLQYQAVEAVVTLDGDEQHDPVEIPRLLAGLNDADFVIGSRFLHRYRMPLYRELGEQFIVWVCGLGETEQVYDVLSGFRAFRRPVLEKVKITESAFGFTIETIIKAKYLGFRVVEVPISCIYHPDRRDNSTYPALRHGWEELKAAVKWRSRYSTMVRHSVTNMMRRDRFGKSNQLERKEGTGMRWGRHDRQSPGKAIAEAGSEGDGRRQPVERIHSQPQGRIR